MDVEMKMPDVATVDQAVTIVRWLVEVGQPVRRGQPLLEVETDKSTLVVESPVTGTLQSITARADVEIPVGAVIATFDAAAAGKPGPALGPQPIGQAEPTAPNRPPPPVGKTGSFFAKNRQEAQGKIHDEPTDDESRGRDADR